MAKLLRNRMAIAAALLLAAASVPLSATAEPVSSGIKQGWDKVTRFFSPKTPAEPPQDALSLSSQAKPGPDLYIATARMYEQKGQLDLAEKQYQQGLRAAPKHVGLQLGYARLKDRQGRLDEAVQLYTDAAKSHPEEAAVYNDLGLCLARHNKLADAVGSLETAARLQPQRILYRNNLATILVDMGRPDAALTHLKAVHSDAVACYNLGYLLQKKGDSRGAATYFARALEHDPSLMPARQWLDRLVGSQGAGPQMPSPNAAASPPRMAYPPGAGPSGMAPRPLPPVEPQAGAVEPRSAFGPGGMETNANPDQKRPVALPSIDEPPPSPGQSPDVSVPVPNAAPTGALPNGKSPPFNRFVQRPLDPMRSRVTPLPTVENAPLPPAADESEPRTR